MSDENPELNVVTGAFGYTGRYITQRLLALGKKVRTLTGHPNRQNSFGGRVEAAPLDFGRPAELQASLAGATVLYNTYWVRFDHGRVSFELAVTNTKKLIQAAKDAGVRKIVHISIANSCPDCSLPYYRGKAELENAIIRSGMSYAIIRPTVIFGDEDILINNIAWLVRRWPVFAIPGAGDYRLQPVFVEDVAELAAHAGQAHENIVTDAVGPEVYTFEEIVRLIAAIVHSRTKIVHVTPGMTLLLTRLVGWTVRDVILTRDEIGGLMSNLLVSADPPMAHTSFRGWITQKASTIGQHYVSELGRHFR